MSAIKTHTSRHLAFLALLTVVLAACNGSQSESAGSPAPTYDNRSVPGEAETSASAAARTESSPGSSTWPVGGTPMAASATAGSATAASAEHVPPNISH